MKRLFDFILDYSGSVRADGNSIVIEAPLTDKPGDVVTSEFSYRDGITAGRCSFITSQGLGDRYVTPALMAMVRTFEEADSDYGPYVGPVYTSDTGLLELFDALIEHKAVVRQTGGDAIVFEAPATDKPGTTIYLALKYPRDVSSEHLYSVYVQPALTALDRALSGAMPIEEAGA